MRRPKRSRLATLMKPVVRFNMGRNKLVEAVELRSGITVVEYTYTNKFRKEDNTHQQQRRLAIFTEDGRYPMDTILETTYVEELPK